MTNKEIEHKGYELVIDYEKTKGRKAKLIRKNGYDIESTDSKGMVRFIEVKSTQKEKPKPRKITELGVNKMKEPNSYFYLVTNIGSTKATVTEYKGDTLSFQKVIIIKYKVIF